MCMNEEEVFEKCELTREVGIDGKARKFELILPLKDISIFILTSYFLLWIKCLNVKKVLSKCSN